MYRTKLRGYLTLSLAMIALVLGCETDVTQPTETEAFRNPYDWVGKEHNECISYVMDRVAAHPDSQWQAIDAINLVQEYFGSNKDLAILTGIPHPRGFPPAELLEFVLNLAYGGRERYISFLDSLQSEGALSRRFSELSLEILDAIDSQASTHLLNAICVKVDTAEIPVIEKDLLLLQVAIARHSKELWEQASCSTDPFPMLSVAPPLLIAGMDVIGGVAGGIVSYRSGNSATDAIVDGLIIGGATSACGFLGLLR